MILTRELLSNEIWKSLPCADRLVYIALILRADEKGECFPSIKKISEDTGLGKTTIIKSLKRLGVLGLLSKSPYRPKHTNYYTIKKIE